MRYKLLGASGLRVSQLCLGTMTFGTQNWGAEEAEAAAIYTRFREAGGNFIDTANEVYAAGRSEEVLGRLMAGHRDDMVLASKYSFAYPGGNNVNAGGNQRKSLRRSVESSLRRLNTDYLDVLWVHAWDRLTPVEETMRALDDLVREGKVLYLGISNAPAWVVAKCNTLAQARGWTPFVAIQAEYNLLERSVEHELLPMASDFGLSIAAWSPLASGILSGKYGGASSSQGGKRLDHASLKKLDERSLDIARAVTRVAEAIERTPSQVALNWVRAQPRVIPILGARTLSQLQDNLGCLDFELTPEQLHELDQLNAPALHYPHDFLANYRSLLDAGFGLRIDTGL
jgi:aryl-alcohol dehydrogenase-like predicted oxidoreductase